MIHAHRIGAVALVVALAACGGEATEPSPEEDGASEAALVDVGPEVDDAVARVPWQTLGTGVSAKKIGDGKEILVVYGGYTARDVYVQRWASALFRKKGEALGIGHLVAVRGPNQSGYANREIGNSKLAAYLGAGPAAEATSIVVVAHSSGTYVAAELFAQLAAGKGNVPPDTLSKVSLMNLDGGGLDSSALGPNGIARAYFVYACDAAVGRCSHNADAMRSLGERYRSLGGSFRVKASGTGCSATKAGGLWCLHDAVVTTRPHDPTFYDLGRDYTDFDGDGRDVVTSYLDVLTPR